MIKYNREIGKFWKGAVVATVRNQHYKLEEGEHDYGVGWVEKLILFNNEIHIAVDFINPKNKGQLDVMHPKELVVLSDDQYQANNGNYYGTN